MTFAPQIKLVKPTDYVITLSYLYTVTVMNYFVDIEMAFIKNL